MKEIISNKTEGKRVILWMGFLRMHFMVNDTPEQPQPRISPCILSQVYGDDRIEIYIGNHAAAANSTLLKKTEITHIVNCAFEIPCFWDGSSMNSLLDQATNANLTFMFGFIAGSEEAKEKLTMLRSRFSAADFQCRYCSLTLLDRNDEDIEDHIMKVHNWLKTEMEILPDKKMRILFHCHAGISRSSSILIGFLMKYKSWSFEESLKHLMDVYPRAKPNDGFLSQLKNIKIDNDAN